MSINQAEIHRKSTSGKVEERIEAVGQLENNFAVLPDKKQAWNDLIRLTQDEDRGVRGSVAEALGSVFLHISDKEKAWDDLLRLTLDEDGGVCASVVEALGSAFQHIPDKERAWLDLHRLSRDNSISVRMGAAEALGAAFAHVPDREAAWLDLHRLSRDDDRKVRVQANYALGRVAIFRATGAETEEDFRKEIENALAFFEKSSIESPVYYKPASFCLPFYRSFYTITFKKQEAETEVQRYLAEAKYATEGSESRKKLIEAVENLADALREVQDAGKLDFAVMKSDLKTYKQYCDRAADLLRTTEEKAPTASKIIRKGMRIIDSKIKEIQHKAYRACQEAKGTPAEEIACAVNTEVQEWMIGDQEQMTQNVERLILIFKSKTPDIPENKHIRGKIEDIRKEKDVVRQYDIVNDLVDSLLTTQIIFEKLEKIDEKIVDIQSKSGMILEHVQKIELSCNQIIRDIEEKGVKLRAEDKHELKTLADDLRAANKEQLTHFTQGLIKLLEDPKIQKELKKQSPKERSRIKKTLKGIASELGIAVSAAVTAEGFLPHIEAIMSQIGFISHINPALAAALILIPLIALKERTLK